MRILLVVGLSGPVQLLYACACGMNSRSQPEKDIEMMIFDLPAIGLLASKLSPLQISR